jgi:hypothetical protein
MRERVETAPEVDQMTRYSENAKRFPSDRNGYR